VSIDFFKARRNQTYEIALKPNELDALERLSFASDGSSIRELIRDYVLSDV